jgi:DNA-binding NarL/FixJ family response regulator
VAGTGTEGGYLPSTPPEGSERELDIRVLIVEDHLLMAEGMASVLQNHGVDVVGIARSGREAVAVAKRERPSVVLMDIGLPDVDGIDAGREILEQVPEARLLALTGLESADVLQEAIVSGFHGYLQKSAPCAELIKSIRVVASGQAVMPQDAAQSMAGRASGGPEGAERNARRLTQRQLDVLALLVEGADTAQVARRLYLSPNTVRTHIQNILAKLQVHSRLEAASYAVRHNLVRPPRPRGTPDR